MIDKRTRVLHISTSDSNGGASKAAFKLHMGMLRENISSKMLVLHKGSDERSIVKYELKKTFKQRMFWLIYVLSSFFLVRFLQLQGIARSGEIFSKSFNPYLIDKSLLNVDAIIIHWNVDFINLYNLFKLIPKQTKIFWRLADMHPFTGGCHYAFACNKFAIGCGKCPELNSKQGIDASRIAYWQKEFTYNRLKAMGKDLRLIVLSNWMKDQLSISGLMKDFPVVHIPNGVELDEFYPLSSMELQKYRGAYDVQSNRINILVIADDLKNKRKGLEILKLAAKKFPQVLNQFRFYFVSSQKDIELNFPFLNTCVLPKTNLKQKLRIYYGIVDATLYLSLEENFSNVILETLACGKPVIGFDSGGAKDILRHQTNSLLSSQFNIGGLYYVFSQVLKFGKQGLEKMGKNGLSIIKHNYSMETCIAAYIRELNK